jgi:hypothetical protein
LLIGSLGLIAFGRKSKSPLSWELKEWKGFKKKVWGFIPTPSLFW